jgi:ribosomal protein S8
MLTRTQNGALSCQTTNPLVALYFNLIDIDNVDDDNYIPILESAWRCITYLLKEHKIPVRILNHLSHYGYFKDYQHIHALYPIDEVYVNTFVKHLSEDFIKVLFVDKPGKVRISLAAKYAPNNKQPFAKEIRNRMRLSAQQYRLVLTTLRSHLNIVETKSCKQQWDQIDYSIVSSLAFLKHKKSFKSHDGERFNQFIENKGKINVGQLYPHQIVKLLFDRDTDACEMFDQYLNKHRNMLKDCVIVCDTSGSMMNGNNEARPIDVAIALTLMAACNNQGAFHNTFFTFSSESELVSIIGDNWIDRVHNISTTSWGNSTNIQSVFDQLLKYNEDIKNVIVISDMQFDLCNESSTNFEEIEKKYTSLGRKRPNFVFWNVSGIGSDIPVRESEKGVVLVSGYSASLFKLIAEGDENITPLAFVEMVVNHPMYERIIL